MSSTRNWILFSLLVAGLALAACGGAATTPAPAQATVAPAQPTQPPAQEPAAPTEAPEEGAQLPAVNPLAVSGDIVTAGSSTVFPLAERMAERFKDEGYAGNITIDSIGTRRRLRALLQDRRDRHRQRQPRDQGTEVEACKAIGRKPVEFRVGTDALAVVVSAENDFVDRRHDGGTGADLSARPPDWADVNPAWPAEPILRFSPGTDSGTFDYFVEA